MPSNTEQLSPWQLLTTQKLETLHQEAFLNHKALTFLLQELPAPKGQYALHDVAFALHIAGYRPDEDNQGCPKARFVSLHRVARYLHPAVEFQA